MHDFQFPAHGSGAFNPEASGRWSEPRLLFLFLLSLTIKVVICLHYSRRV